MPSIKHYATGHPLPDFRNFGTMPHIPLRAALGHRRSSGKSSNEPEKAATLENF
jgi:hypothetical protein